MSHIYIDYNLIMKVLENYAYSTKQDLTEKEADLLGTLIQAIIELQYGNGNVDRAAEFFSLVEKQKTSSSSIKIYYKFAKALFYLVNENTDEAIARFELAHQHWSRLNNEENLAWEELPRAAHSAADIYAELICHLYLGLCYLQEDNFKQAELYFTRALGLCVSNQIEQQHSKCFTQFQLGIALKNQAQYDKALNNFQVALTLSAKKGFISAIYFEIAQCEKLLANTSLPPSRSSSEKELEPLETPTTSHPVETQHQPNSAITSPDYDALRARAQRESRKKQQAIQQRNQFFCHNTDGAIPTVEPKTRNVVFRSQSAPLMPQCPADTRHSASKPIPGTQKSATSIKDTNDIGVKTWVANNAFPPVPVSNKKNTAQTFHSNSNSASGSTWTFERVEIKKKDPTQSPVKSGLSLHFSS